MSSDDFGERITRIIAETCPGQEFEIVNAPKRGPCSVTWQGVLRISPALADSSDLALATLFSSIRQAQKRSIVIMLLLVSAVLALVVVFQPNHFSFMFVFPSMYYPFLEQNCWKLCLRKKLPVKSLFETIASYRYRQMLLVPHDRFDHGAVALSLIDELNGVKKVAIRMHLEVPEDLVEKTVLWAKEKYRLPTSLQPATPAEPIPYTSSLDKRYRS